MSGHRLATVGLALMLAGCAIPSWVPWLGKSTPPAPPSVRASAPPVRQEPPPTGDVKTRPPGELDDSVADRVVAVVNNDAITLGELQETIAVYRQENRGQRTQPSDDELIKQFLPRLIDNRLQLQEADRERVVVEDAELNEELAERIKTTGARSMEEFERAIKQQGITLESVKKRLRESLRVQKVVRRKVALRVSVTDAEINQYLEENRAKLETGLSYHARHILVTPDGGGDDAAWEAARIRADMIRTQVREGADFGELARQHSKDASARDGGDLGILKRGELSQEIENEILKLQAGEISPPYRSSLGWHIFKLEAKDSLEGEGLVRAKQQIRDILFRQKYTARLEAWLKEIKQRAIIEVRI